MRQSEAECLSNAKTFESKMTHCPPGKLPSSGNEMGVGTSLDLGSLQGSMCDGASCAHTVHWLFSALISRLGSL